MEMYFNLRFIKTEIYKFSKINSTFNLAMGICQK